jgi:hypothetical protein
MIVVKSAPSVSSSGSIVTGGDKAADMADTDGEGGNSGWM